MFEDLKNKIFSKLDFLIKNNHKSTKKDFYELKDLLNNLIKEYEKSGN